MVYNFLVGCIWQFNGCVEHKWVEEEKCHERFDECSMIAMGMSPDMTQETSQASMPAQNPNYPASQPTQDVADTRRPVNSEY